MAKGPFNKRPREPRNFYANLEMSRRANRYATGEDIVFRWDYQVHLGQGRIPCEVIYGRALESGLPDRQGLFRIKVYDGVTLVRTIDAIDGVTATYDNADLVADFGGEPTSFTVTLLNYDGAYESDEQTITIDKE